MTSETVRIAILTISDGVAAGTRRDDSGDAIESWAGEHGHALVERRTVGDATPDIASALVALCDAGADVVITTGGTGFTKRDVTPEATASVIERVAPGIAERIRFEGWSSTPNAALSRGLAGIRGNSLIVNLPGSTGGVREGLAVLDTFISHAVQLLRGVDTGRHG